MTATSSHTVVYDGLCRFCLRSLRVVRATDVLGRLRYLDANDREAVLAELPELVGADLDDALFLVDRSRRTYRGFYAFRRIATTNPPLWPLVPLLYLPGVALLGERAYALIARNRSRLGCRVDRAGDC